MSDQPLGSRAGASCASEHSELPASGFDPVELRLTSRLVTAIQNAVRGGLRSFRDAHGDTLSDGLMSSAAKRAALGVWGVLRTHPDVSRVNGALPSELPEALATCEAECSKRSAMIQELRAQLSALTLAQERLQEENVAWRKLYDDTPRSKDAPDAFTVISMHNRLMMEWRAALEAAEQRLSTLSASLTALRDEMEALIDRWTTKASDLLQSSDRYVIGRADGRLEVADHLSALLVREEP